MSDTRARSGGTGLYNTSTGEVKVERSGFQSQPIVHNKLIYILGYLRPCKKRNKSPNKPTHKAPKHTKTKCK